MRRVVRWKNEESHIVPLPAALGQRRGLIQMSLDPPLLGLELPPRAKKPGVQALRHHVAASRPAGSRSDRQRRHPQRRTGREVRRHPEPDGRPDGAYRFRTVEVDEQQVNLTRFNLLFPRKRPSFSRVRHLQLRLGAGPNVNGADVPRSSSADRSAQPGQPVPSSPAAASRERSGLPGRSAQHPDRRQAVARGVFHQLQRDPATARLCYGAAPGRDVYGRSRSLAAAARAPYGADAGFSFFDTLNINAAWRAQRRQVSSGNGTSAIGPVQLRRDRYGLVLERLVIEEGSPPRSASCAARTCASGRAPRGSVRAPPVCGTCAIPVEVAGATSKTTPAW